MNFAVLKTDFKQYLAASGKIDAAILQNDADISLFDYADDFREYLSLKFKGSPELAVQSQNIKETAGTIAANQDISSENSSITAGMLRELLKNENFKNKLDIDKSGSVDKIELEFFLDTIKDLDNDKNNLSAEDILSAAEKLTEEEAAEREQDIEDKPAPEPDKIPQNSGNLSRLPGFSMPSYSSLPSMLGSSLSSGTSEYMTESEIISKINAAKADLAAKKNALSDLMQNGNDKINRMKSSAENAYKTYYERLKNIDETTAAELDRLKQDIESKNTEIDSKTAAAETKKIDISNAENTYKNAKSNRENLEKIVKELKSSNSGNNADNKSQTAQAEAKLNEAKRAEAAAKSDLETKKQELKTLEKEIEQLKNGKGGLSELNAQVKALNEKAAKNQSDMKILQEKWLEEQKEIEKEKTKAVQKAKADAVSAQNKVNELQTMLSDIQNRKNESTFSSGKYNAQKGKSLAQAGYSTIGSKGYCLRGVNNTLMRVFGQRINRGSAYQAAEVLASNKGIGAHFREVQVSRRELSRLPAGAIVVWNNNARGGGSNVTRAGKVHGHISIALGNGMESSDHISNQIVNRDAQFRVFLPV